MKSDKIIKKEKGITLIALVVTIVVLLILAAVSISMLGGENGIITQAKESREKTEQAKVEEIVDITIVGLMTENEGSANGITPKDIANRINEEYSQYENVYAEDESNFPTKIIFPEEGDREVDVDLTGILKDIYDTDISQSDIAPTEIFSYEIISNADTGATSFDSLPTKEARITGIKPEYCNGSMNGYESETGEIYENTNYEIILKDGSKISDTLVIPYQVEIDGEMYKITEANIWTCGNGMYYGFPKIKTLVYPNTIEKIEGYYYDEAYFTDNETLEKVVLPNNLKEIGDASFWGCDKLTNIEIPNTVTSIGKDAFYSCDSLNNIKIPSNVISIGIDAFRVCSSLKTVNYTGTKAQWQQINIGSGNGYLTMAQIICTDGTLSQ